MFASTGDLVIFAIRAGLKLGQQGRIAYAEATIKRELVLPLPNFNPEASQGTADGYFSGQGKIYLEALPRLKELYDKSIKGQDLSDSEKREYVEYYLDFKREDDIRAGIIRGDEIGLTTEALLSLVKVRQWSLQKSPFPSAYQRILGTLIEVGIDYFSRNPDLIDSKSATGRALLGFLNSIDDLDLASGEPDVLAQKLFVAAIESISENPDLLGADRATEHLVETFSRGLVADINRHVAKIGEKDLTKKERLYDWAQVVLRSILSSSGSVILENPSTYLAIDQPAQQSLVSSVGRAILDLLIEDETLNLENLFTRRAIDNLVGAALTTLSEYPSLLGVDNLGIKKILSQVAGELASSVKELGPDMLPEIMRIILEKTAVNAELVWPDGFQDPSKHLLITASKELLEELAKPPTDGSKWKPRLSRDQILDVLEITLDEVVRNPQWLIEMADGTDAYLGAAVKAAINALEKVPPNRITASTAGAVIKEVIRAISRRRDFLDKISVGEKTGMVIELALENIVERILSDDADRKTRWALAREEVFEDIVEIVLDQLEQTGMSPESIQLLDKALEKSVQRLASGGSWGIPEFIDEVTLVMNGGINGE